RPARRRPHRWRSARRSSAKYWRRN
ncbi:uncharacterized protein METZ01_LOCUS104418, partial [marine metagenome]